jgi:hypothetical protein
MTPIISREQQDTILTSEITEQHLVVVFYDSHPCILTKGFFQEKENIDLLSFQDYFTLGNGFRVDGKNIKEKVELLLEDSECQKIAVFHESDWKKALQWLIDNAK